MSNCSNCSWQYGVRSPDPSGLLYGGLIQVKMPSNLPNLKCSYVIFASVSSGNNYFYQTSLGFTTAYGWHVSAGTNNPQLSCDLACPPFKLRGNVFRPQAGKPYELGIRFVPQNGGYEVRLYFVDLSSLTFYDIYKVTDTSSMATPVGAILESWNIDGSDLNNVGGSNCFEVVNANWLIEPWISRQWPNGLVHGPTTQTCQWDSQYNSWVGFQAVPKNQLTGDSVKINKISAGDFKIGWNVGGDQYQDGYTLW
jgi:hypothetical protein